MMWQTIKLGLPTLIEFETIEDCAKLCQESNLEFIEINMSLPQYTVEAIDTDKFNDIAIKYGISYTIHLDENTNFFDFNTYTSNAAFRYVEDSIKLAKKINANVINMHFKPGEHFTLPDKKVYLYGHYREHYLNQVNAFKNMCETAIGDSGIKVCIENCNGFLDFQKEALGIMLESKVFSLTFDIGHNRSCGGVDEPYIIEKQDKLCHMHLHDAYEKKNHLTLGTGELDLNAYLNLARNCNCTVVVEVKTAEGLQNSVAWLKDNGWMA